MNNLKVYESLVEKAKVRGLDKSKHKGYFEIHHIIPRCLGGDNSEENLVMLTGREHFIAHILLWKIYPYAKPIAYAARMMTHRVDGCRLTSNMYEKLKAETDPQPVGTESHRFKDKTGIKINNLTVLCIYDWITKPNGRSLVVWSCRCDCGNLINVRGNHLNQSGTRSCGCMTHLGIINYNVNITPWERSLSSTRESWTNADHYYDVWLFLDKPTSSHLFASGMRKNNLHSKTKIFTKLILKFQSGWEPSLDSGWNSWRMEYLSNE